MKRPLATAWLRLKETPLELTISSLAALVGVIQVAYEWDTLTWQALAVDIVLVIGGAGVITGRLADEVDIESGGLAFLIAAFGFLFLQDLPDASKGGVEAVLGLVFNFGALVAGYAIRLRVVRVAAKARRRAAELRGSGYVVR